jgi:hypothetical protein
VVRAGARGSASALLAAATGATFVACNVLLDNERGVLALTSDGGAERGGAERELLPDAETTSLGATAPGVDETGATASDASAPPPARCRSGHEWCARACVLLGDADRAECDGTPGDGREADLRKDARSSGARGITCLVGPLRDGACRLPGE